LGLVPRSRTGEKTFLARLFRAAAVGGVPGSAQTGTNFPGTKVEPFVAVNPLDELKLELVGGWQQDRWSDGGAKATFYDYSADGGATWQPAATQPAFSRCTDGTPANGGDYERSTDPWVSVSPNGTAYAFSLSFNQTLSGENALLVSKSTDGGATWRASTVRRPDSSRALSLPALSSA
jgi:hypothetical protein